MAHQIYQEAQALAEELVAARRALHQIPELGTELPKTVAFITEKLDALGIPYEVYEDCSCVVATVGKGGKCFLLRSDMDGLPVQEDTGLPFASTNGCMHACGHDLHATTLLGAAKLLKAHESELKGTVKLFFQSGEELFAGAQAAMAHGLLENPKVDAAFAMHVFGALPAGKVVYGHYAMSAVYGFRFLLTGKGTHGSSPESGIDPINTGLHIHLALQELIAREVSALDEAALTIGKFSAGTAFNVIPHTAVLEGSLRTFKPEVTDYLRHRIDEVARAVAKAYRTEIEIETISLVPATICDEPLTREFLDSIASLDADIPVAPEYHVMGSEDFAFISEKIPSSYMAIGAGGPDPSTWRGQHNPQILFEESVLPTGAAIYAKAAMDWLEKHG